MNRTRGQHIEARLEDIHDKVEELISSRRNVKEVLVVLEQDDGDSAAADFVLQDRTSRNKAPNPQTNNRQGSSQNVREPSTQSSITSAC